MTGDSAPSKLGILGGGQLARMTIEAASTLGIDVVIGEKSSRSPASRVASGEILFNPNWDDRAALARLASSVPVVTLESEFVDAPVLEALETLGARVLPGPASVGVVQDKLLQKQLLAANAVPVPAFRKLNSPEDLAELGKTLGWPVMLKARRDGYDGHGNLWVHEGDGALEACQRLGWPERTLYAEAAVPFTRELAVMVVRGGDGKSVPYPVVESRQHPSLHLCETVLAPARGATATAADIAVRAVDVAGLVGVVGVEMFELEDGRVLVNELAPRPHNTGHYTIEACETSQFENHVRAVLGMPVGSVSLRAPAAAMVNILGSREGCARPDRAALNRALAVPGAHVHLYGKEENRPGRKLGHVTVVGARTDEALSAAEEARCLLAL